MKCSQALVVLNVRQRTQAHKQTAYTERMLHIFSINLIVGVLAMAAAIPFVLIREAHGA